MIISKTPWENGISRGKKIVSMLRGYSPGAPDGEDLARGVGPSLYESVKRPYKSYPTFGENDSYINLNPAVAF